MKQGGSDVSAQIQKGYEIMLYSAMSPEKLKLFLNLYTSALKEFSENKEDAVAMTGAGKEISTPQGAALMVVANALLNLDEVVTKN